MVLLQDPHPHRRSIIRSSQLDPGGSQSEPELSLKHPQTQDRPGDLGPETQTGPHEGLTVDQVSEVNKEEMICRDPLTADGDQTRPDRTRPDPTRAADLHPDPQTCSDDVSDNDPLHE